ncbi:hypothetical protein [Dankookia sp. P2]|uniref:hypothetical protein n=1 Tax=Dankookia sp. P2 TaxID=3423955 RepID=UPI003D675F82
MADGNRRHDQVHGAAETARRGAQQAAKDATRAGTEIIGQVTKATAQQGDAVMEAAARQAGEATERGAEVVRRSGAEVARRVEAVEADGRQFAQRTVRETVEAPVGLRPPMDGMAALPQAFAGMLGEMARANWQIGQEMLRLVNPVALIDLQQKMLHGYLDLILAGQAKLDRTVRTAEASMPPRQDG